MKNYYSISSTPSISWIMRLPAGIYIYMGRNIYLNIKNVYLNFIIKIYHLILNYFLKGNLIEPLKNLQNFVFLKIRLVEKQKRGNILFL